MFFPRTIREIITWWSLSLNCNGDLFILGAVTDFAPVISSVELSTGTSLKYLPKVGLDGCLNIQTDVEMLLNLGAVFGACGLSVRTFHCGVTKAIVTLQYNLRIFSS